MQMPVFSRLSTDAVTIGALLGSAATALAAPGQPSPWALGLQEAGSPVMADITWFHDFLLVIITAITAFVLILLLVVMIRFNARANPRPSRTTHNALIEVVWTIVPVVILLAIAVPSFRLLFLIGATTIRTSAFSSSTRSWWRTRISSPISRGSSPSTTRWSCRSIRWCTCW